MPSMLKNATRRSDVNTESTPHWSSRARAGVLFPLASIEGQLSDSIEGQLTKAFLAIRNMHGIVKRYRIAALVLIKLELFDEFFKPKVLLLP